MSSIKKWKSRKKKKSNRDKSLSKKTYRIPMHLKAEPDSHLPDKCRKSLSIVDWMSSIKKVHLDILILWSIRYLYATYIWSLIDVRKSGQEEVQGILMKPKLLRRNTTTFEREVKTLCFSLLLWSITKSIFNALPSIGCTNFVGVGHKREIKLWPKSPQWNIQFTRKTNYWLTLFDVL